MKWETLALTISTCTGLHAGFPYTTVLSPLFIVLLCDLFLIDHQPWTVKCTRF